MKLLVTGGSSFLGSHILKCAPQHSQLAATYWSHPITQPHVAAFRIDMRDADAIQRVIAATRPDVIIHTPAVMSGEMLSPLNVSGARAVASAAAAAHARLIHISSDVIFDGAHAPYDESAEPHPITPYAESKARAERAVREENPHALVVRTSLIYGFDPIDPRTRDLLDGRMPRLFTDEFRCPILVNDLADALLEIAHDIAAAAAPTLAPHCARCSAGVPPPLGVGAQAASVNIPIINIAGPQKLSRYEFGLKLARAFGVEPRFESALSTSHPTPRPRDCALDVSLAQKILRSRLRSVDEVLSQISLSP